MVAIGFNTFRPQIKDFSIFQLSLHDKLVNSKAFHIQLFIHIQSFLAKEIKDCQQNLKVSNILALFNS